MFLKAVSSDISASQLAELLADKLGVRIPISKNVDPDTFFQFDPDAKVVICSDETVSSIAKKEASDEKTAASYKAILKMANEALNAPDEVIDCIRYAAFCCLHEFGHYAQSLDLTDEELEEMANQREKRIDEANKEAQEQADRKVSQQEVLEKFEARYREIPIEKDADMRAIEMLKLIDGTNSND